MRILYILGRGRGGSTVLANVIGEIPGFFSAGEVRYLWDPVVVRHSACGCGQAIDECPVWSRVLAALDDVDLDQVVGWQHEIVKEANTLRLLNPKRSARWHALKSYAEVTARLYKTIEHVTGCNVIVDSSKRPSYAAFIRALGDCDPYFVHLIRDPRASAYSWHTRRYASAHGNEVKRRNAFDSTVRWNLLNVGSELVRRAVGGDRFLRMRYEDFVKEPIERVRDICSLIGDQCLELPFTGEHSVRLSANHTIAGNPSRFSTGDMVLRDTGEWLGGQGVAARLVSTVVALPLLRHYGYGIRPAG